MSTKIITLEGLAQYAKVFEDNRDMKGYEDEFVDCNGAYTIDLKMDDVEYQKLQDSGSKLVGRMDEDGFHIVKFKRRHETRNKKTGEVIDDFSGPPRVVDAESTEWVHSEDAPNYIGNDSRVLVAVSVQPDKKKKSIVYTRLEGVQVLELEEWDGQSSSQMKLPF